MKQKKCDKCGKIIEGYNEEHINYLIKQHQLGKKCNKK
jgi:hypothetical protein